MLHVDLSCLEKYFFQVCHTHLKLDLEGMHLISLQNNIINSRWFLYVTKNDANSSMQRLQSCSCHSPRKTKKLHSHMYTCSIDVSIMLDLNCAYTSCIYVKTRDGKKTLHTICWVYMSRARRIKNNSCLNLMAGTSCEKNRNMRSQLIMHAC